MVIQWMILIKILIVLIDNYNFLQYKIIQIHYQSKLFSDNVYIYALLVHQLYTIYYLS